MKLIELLSAGLAYGKAYNVTIQTYTDHTPVTERLYFGGFRLKNDSARVDNADSIVPVFMVPNEDGSMSRRVRSGLPTWLEFIVGIEPADLKNGLADFPMPMDGEEAEALSNSVWNITKRTHNNILRLLREMDVLFPGKKIRLDPENPVCAVHYYRHGCESCTIEAVGLNAGKTDLVYDINYECGDNESDVDDDNMGFENKAWLLSIVRDAIADPVFDEDGEDLTFITEGTKAEEIPDPDPEKTPFLYHSKIIERLKKNLKNAGGQPEESPEDSCGHAERL